LRRIKMEQITFNAESREKTGKGAARQLRREGFIPGILYGADSEPVLIKLDRKTSEKILGHLESYNVMANLVLKGEKRKKTVKTVLKEVQMDPLKGRVLHLDFNKIRMDKPIVMEIPVHLIGESPGIEAGGVLEHEMREIQLEALPADMPELIEVNIANMDIGDVILVKDIQFPEKVKTVEEEERTVVSIHKPREEKEEEEEVEEEVVAAEEVETEPEVISEEKAEERRKEKEEKEGEEKAK
jgi:large subunit ribosomal protein L25